jgi:hypothetical protein
MLGKTSPKECPVCDTVSPASAERCDCGYVFSQDDVSVAHRQSAALIRRGAVITAIGIVTLLVFLMLSNKGYMPSSMVPRAVIGGFLITGVSALLYGLRKRFSRGANK